MFESRVLETLGGKFWCDNSRNGCHEKNPWVVCFRIALDTQEDEARRRKVPVPTDDPL